MSPAPPSQSRACGRRGEAAMVTWGNGRISTSGRVIAGAVGAGLLLPSVLLLPSASAAPLRHSVPAATSHHGAATRPALAATLGLISGTVTDATHSGGLAGVCVS